MDPGSAVFPKVVVLGELPCPLHQDAQNESKVGNLRVRGQNMLLFEEVHS